MLAAADASLGGNLLNGKMSKSCFDKTPAEGSLLGGLLGEGYLDKPLLSGSTVGPLS